MIAYRLVDEIAERLLDLIDDAERRDRRARGQRRELACRRDPRARISELRHDLLHIRKIARATARRDPQGRRRPDRARWRRGLPARGRAELRATPTTSSCARSTASRLSRDLVAGVRDYFQAKIANDQNEVTKRAHRDRARCSARADLHRRRLRPELHDTIPELHWSFGYAWSWGWIVVTTVAAALVLPAQALDLRHALATIAACRTSSARAARHARSTTTGARALDQPAAPATAAASAFLFELLEDYYPAPNTGFVVSDQERADPRHRPRRVRADGLPRAATCSAATWSKRSTRSLGVRGTEPAQVALEWGVRRSGVQPELRSRVGHVKPVTADFFPGLRRRRRALGRHSRRAETEASSVSDPGLQLLERLDRTLELAQLGAGGGARRPHFGSPSA